MNIPFEEIKDTLDRSWSDQLLSMIETASADDPLVDEAVDALSDLVDPAVTERLFAIGTDQRRGDVVRSRALEVICESGLSLERDALREWWESGDLFLQREALENAYRTEADYLRPIAQDPLHPLYRHAIRALKIGFDDPEWQSCIVGALSHFDPAVQEVGTELAVWEEPIAAEAKLIELANGERSELAIRAIRTLEYYCSRSSIRALSELVHHHESERSEEAREAVGTLANEFQRQLEAVESPLSRDHLTEWMRPVIDVVVLHGIDRSYDEQDESTSAEQPSISLPVHGQELAAALLDVGGQWSEKRRWLEKADWSGESDSDRRLLGNVLCRHVDPIVRRNAARILAGWHDIDGLLELANDPYIMVREHAIFWLEATPASASVADMLWPLIGGDLLGGWAAREALATWLRHSPENPTERLVEMALHETRQGLQWTAVNELGSEHAGLIASLLDAPPEVSWSAHSMLLENLASERARPAALSQFLDVDDLYVAAACAEFAAFD